MGNASAEDPRGMSAHGDRARVDAGRSADADATAQRPAPAEKDEIVVASTHAQAILGELAGHATVTAVDRRLGLSRLLFDDGAGAAARFDTELASPVVRLGDSSVTLTAPSDPVGRILTGLRVRFAAAYGGWFPVMGRNRVLVSPESGYMVIRTPEGVDPTPGRRPDYASEGGQGLTIGVLDTPVVEQDDFSWQLKPSSTRLSALPPWPSALGHSTFLAGILARYAPESSIKVRGVLTGENGTADAWDVAVGLLDLVESGADLVTLAMGCFTTDNQPPLVLQTAVSLVRDRALLVAASGNYGHPNASPADAAPADAAASDTAVSDTAVSDTAGSDTAVSDTAVSDPAEPERPVPAAKRPMWPAAVDGVVAVGAGNPEGTGPADFTPDAPWIQLLAPGVAIDSTYLAGPVLTEGGRQVTFEGYARWSGSSLSAAVAAGRLSAAAGRYLDGGSRQSANDRRRALRRALRDALQGKDDVLRPFAGPSLDPSGGQEP